MLCVDRTVSFRFFTLGLSISKGLSTGRVGDIFKLLYGVLHELFLHERNGLWSVDMV